MDQFSLEELNTALRDIQDLLDRCVIQCMPLGDTAKGIREGKLFGDKIQIGIKKRYLTREVRNTIYGFINKAFERGYSKTMLIDLDKDNIIKYDVGGVPIDIKIIERNYSFFKNLEPLVYNYDDFWLPNPLDRYLKAQYIIR